MQEGGPRKFADWQASFVDGAGGQSVTARMWERMTPLVDSGSREFYNLRADPLQDDDLLANALTPTQRERLDALDRQPDQLLATR